MTPLRREEHSTGSPAAEPSGAAGAPAGPLLEIGRVGRPHGTAGDVTVTLVSNRPERLAPGSELHTAAGVLRVLAARPHNQRHLVAFEGIDDRSKAEGLRGLVLQAAPIDDPDETWVHELIGARVVDQSGVDRGPVASVVANPAGDLLELADGTLVPLRFVVASVPCERIDVDVPDGLFEGSGPEAERIGGTARPIRREAVARAARERSQQERE